MNRRIILVICFLGFLFFYRARFTSPKKDKEINREKVDEWKSKVRPSFFIGEVQSIEKSDNDPRFYAGVYMTLVDSVDLNIPGECRYLRLKEGRLILDVHHQSLRNSPRKEILPGDIIRKKSNNDSIYVYSPDSTLKYWFEIFDGIKRNLNY